jgi:hypothetical protein
MGIRGGRRKQLRDEINETRSYCKLKAEALDLTLWRTSFGRGYGPVVRADSVIVSTITIVQIVLLFRFIPQEFGCRVAFASA